MAASIAVLNAAKEKYFRRMQAMYDLIKKFKTDASATKQFEIRYELFEETRTFYYEKVTEINELELKADPKYEPSFLQTDAFDDLCSTVKYSYNTLKASKSTPSTPNPSSQGGLKTPKFNIPDFEGDPEKWTAFQELYNENVHNNATLNDSAKAHLLFSKLKGKALAVVSGITPSGANYALLYKALKDKYDDARFVAHTLVKKLLNYKPQVSESAQGLEHFLENFVASKNALRNLNIQDLADFLFLEIALSKLHKDTLEVFETAKAGTAMPTFDDLIQSVKSRVKVLDRSDPISSASKVKDLNKKTISSSNFDANKKNNSAFTHRSFHALDSTNAKKVNPKPTSCGFCKRGDHLIYSCSDFRSQIVADRVKFIEDSSRCVNCFSSIHSTAECKSKNSCNVCGSRHHTMLHRDQAKPPQGTVNLAGQTLCGATQVSKSTGSVVLLPTAWVLAQDALGKTHRLRMLLDSGSQRPVMSAQAAKVLKLRISVTPDTIIGIGGANCPVRGQTHLKFSPHFDNTTQLPLDCLVIDRISADATPTSINVKELEGLSHFLMADDYQRTPDRIDIAVNAEYFARLIQSGHIHAPDKSWVALSTVLGYVLMGRVPTHESVKSSAHASCFLESPPLEELIQRFWTLEDFPVDKPRSQEDLACEEFFQKTHSRTETGSFEVALPLKESPDLLGDSREMAERRFSSLERRFAKDPTFHGHYSKAVQDLLDKNFLSIANERLSEGPRFFIPHHAVFKPESTTTPVRIVFDASAKSTSGKSLNDILHIGPKLQADVFALLLNFRLLPIALIGDLRQMYLQIYVRPEDRPLQSMLWRCSTEEPLRAYELNRVVFGINSSPYLALRCIQALAEAEGKDFPLASAIVPRDMYVDDLVTSIADLETAKQLVPELEALFKRGGFTLTKFRSNEGRILKLAEEATAYEFDTGGHAKVLGLQWNPIEDTFAFPVASWAPKCTKRTILSTVARIFDPLSLLAPATIRLKLLIKELWALKIEWDEDPPPHIGNAWETLVSEWKLLSEHAIPRHSGVWPGTEVMIIGFCDASTKAYGAAVYLRCQKDSGPISVQLLCAKARVAPQKPVTLARLELCAAVILADLINIVHATYRDRVPIARTFAFTDSTVALWWLKGDPARWKTFVCHRVTKIQSKADVSNFYHVRTQDNVADLLSRGLSPAQLAQNQMWWQGPEWLTEEPLKWPIRPLEDLEEIEVPEKVPAKVLALRLPAAENELLALAWHFSKWNKYRNAVVYVFRILGRFRPLVGPITVEELLEAERRIVKAVQEKHFATDLVALERGEECSAWLRNLHPFLDNGLIRVGGRLRHSKLDFDHRHPWLLPQREHITDLLIAHYHESNFHTGPSLVISLLRQKFWILNIRNRVRNVVRHCNWCFRRKPRHLEPLMGDLPAERVCEAAAFQYAGMDYAGPFKITFKKTRGNKVLTKCYICVFVCFATKAVHLELCSALSTEIFIGALKRFLARRGTCSTLFSDQGTNFVGAKNQLDELYAFLNSPEYLEQFQLALATEGIRFKLNPPAAPHMGGLWESAVKAVKVHLSKVIGDQILTYEEFSTVLTQIECLLNSRPLFLESSDPNDARPITPAHFLVARTLKGFPSNDTGLEDANLHRLPRPKLLDALVRQFWTRWKRDYLHTLQQRSKWSKSPPNIKVNDVVLVNEANTPTLQWPTGIVTKVFPGSDGVVRVAEIRTSRGVYRRPAVKLCPLPTQ